MSAEHADLETLRRTYGYRNMAGGYEADAGFAESVPAATTSAVVLGLCAEIDALRLSTTEPRWRCAKGQSSEACQMARVHQLPGHLSCGFPPAALPSDPEGGEGMSGEREFTLSGTGQLVQGIHPEAECQPPCPIHAPSDHSMLGFPLHWRDDRRIWERICDHGVGHPDPDDMTFKRSHSDPKGYESIHGCDGCCRKAAES